MSHQGQLQHGLRIGIDTLFESPYEATSGVTYLQNLIHGLAKIDKKNDYFLFVSQLNRSLFETVKGHNVHFVECPYSNERRVRRVLSQHIVLPALARRLDLDVLHSPGNISPPIVPCASVVTIQNMLNIHSFRYVAPHVMLYRFLLTRIAARRADLIVAPSRTIGRDISHFLKVSSQKVRVVYQGVNNGQFCPPPSTNLHDILSSYGIVRPYILFVAALRPYKNAHGLLRAFAFLVRKYDIEHNLVIVGSGKGTYKRMLEQIIGEEGLTSRVIFTGYIPNCSMPALYGGADLYVQPSLIESFGLTVIEAMSSGTPTVTSNLAALPEIAGDAAILVDPRNPMSIANGIWRAVSNRQFREDLIRRGQRRAGEFTWERTAEEMTKVYCTAHDFWLSSKQGRSH